jgi:hypothetical protein
LAQATSIYHAASSEAGYTYHPDHATNGKSRAEVLAELEAARKDGTLALIQRGAPLPIKNGGPANTRQQVIDEMRNESPRRAPGADGVDRRRQLSRPSSVAAWGLLAQPPPRLRFAAPRFFASCSRRWL